MKTKLLCLGLVCFMGVLFSCTPVELESQRSLQDVPPIYGTGGEHSTEPDNVKD